MTGLWERLGRYVKGKMMRHLPNMITCREFESFILDYLEDGLPDVQRRQFERHIRICRECREYLHAYRRTIDLGKAVFSDIDANVPEDVPEDLIKAIVAARPRAH